MIEHSYDGKLSSNQLSFLKFLDDDKEFTQSTANTKVRINAINYKSKSAGPGLRTEVFFQGCPHGCYGCFSTDTWDVFGGIEFKLIDLMLMIVPDYSNKLSPFSNLISFCGGEPLNQRNQLFSIIYFLNRWAKHNNKKNHILLYTGYTYEEIKNMTSVIPDIILSEINVLIDGRFLYDKKFDLETNDSYFIGSSNQKYIILDINGNEIISGDALKVNQLNQKDRDKLLELETKLCFLLDDIKLLFNNFDCN